MTIGTRRQERRADRASAHGRRAADPVAADITSRIEARLGSQTFDRFFGSATVEVDAEVLRIHTSSRYAARYIDLRYADDLGGIAREALGRNARVELEVDEASPKRPGDDAAAEPDTATEPAPARRPASPKARGARRGPLLRCLSEFVVGPSNQLAYDTARRLAEDAEPTCSMLFLHGDCGVGKTHLLQGVCRRFGEVQGPAVRTRYVTGEQFTNEFIAAIRNAELDAFRAAIRRLDLLVIDDVHFLANKMRTQAEFLHTLDEIAMVGARVVLASDEHPQAIRSFKQALTSRFLSGLVIQMDTPDRATRRTIIERLAQRQSLRLTPEAIDLVADRCVGSVREIEGAIISLVAMRDVEATTPGGRSRTAVGVLLAERLFEDRRWGSRHPVRLHTIVEVVCDRLGVSRSDLVGSRRHKRVVLARAVIAHLAREMTTHSYPEIARAIGRSYHSTVHTAAQRLGRQLAADEQVSLGDGAAALRLRELVDQLRHEIAKSGRGT